MASRKGLSGWGVKEAILYTEVNNTEEVKKKKKSSTETGCPEGSWDSLRKEVDEQESNTTQGLICFDGPSGCFDGKHKGIC